MRQQVTAAARAERLFRLWYREWWPDAEPPHDHTVDMLADAFREHASAATYDLRERLQRTEARLARAREALRDAITFIKYIHEEDAYDTGDLETLLPRELAALEESDG